MLTITAIIRSKPDHVDTVKQALLDVAENVRRNEPETHGFYVSQDIKDNCVFTTYERFADQDAMDRHNNSAASKRFFEVAEPILDGEVTLVVGEEISAKEENQ